MMIQAVAGPPVPADLRPRAAAPTAPCPVAGGPGEIVVCGSRSQEQRLGPIAVPEPEPADDPLSFRLPGGGKLNAHAMQRTVGGFTGQGAAITLTIPFGKGRKR